MSTVLAVDQSTSGTKAVLFDLEGNIRDIESRGHEQHYPQPGWVEHDAEEIWDNTLAVVRGVTARNASAGSPRLLSITDQRETFVVFDRATGRPLHRAIVWQCGRGDAICQALIAEGREAVVRSKTGLAIDTYFSGSKIAWLCRERPDLAAAMSRGEALVGTIDAYLIYRLTEGRVFATDYTNASRTLLFDVQSLRWDEELCQLFGVPRQALPEVRESSGEFGATNAGGALPVEIPIRGVAGDSQASFFAQRCFEPGMTKATFGSGTSVLLNIGSDFRVPKGGAMTALAWKVAGKPTYALEGLINYSAATVEWLKDHLGLIERAVESEQLATSVDDNGGVYLVPAFAGLGAPYWRSDARAAILGMTAHTTKAHIMRAALESIAFQMRDVLDMMQDASGTKPQCIFADGGGSTNEFLMQTVADVCGVDVAASNIAESSALGGALLGMLGAGLKPGIASIAGEPRELRRYRPRLAPGKVARLYAGWNDAVRRVL